MELSKRYQPSDVEAKNDRFWREGNFFQASPGVVDKAPFSVVIPPPNVTGRLHMGHALNNTLQDVVIRYRRMKGEEACWFPGTDHAGIATQNVVEKELAKEGLSRHDLGREAFVARVWEWKAKYGSEIIEQLEALGCSCDWSRLRFTLDEGLSRAVQESFVTLYNEGLIYRGTYLINWCPRCETALSDIEVEHHDVDGGLYYVRYPLEDGGDVTIATTRPETMLGDTAVAVNPNDERFAHLIGRTARLPLLDRALPVIGAKQVDPEFGTGVLKITPAHDPVDFEIGKAHGLDSVSILNGDGTINENGGPFAGMTREEASRAVIERLDAEGFLERNEPYRHSVGHCTRCDTSVEPIISTQWFVRMKPLAEKAIKAVQDGRIEFIPDRWNKVYFEWLEGIRDWCISRQLWWGHRIPIWYGPDEHPFAARGIEEAGVLAREHYGRDVELRQDEDVLDTWFSSWLWPFSVMGWPEETEDLAAFFPSSFLLTGFDILFFWVSRMIMASLHFMHDIPFRKVFITPLIVDEHGQKMSKSKGNSVDPIDLIEEYGADALRFALAHTTGKGRTMRMPWSQLAEARNFLNKVWNMARFVLLNVGDSQPQCPDKLVHIEDRFIMSRLQRAVEQIRGHLEAYNFNLAAEAIYDFVWHDYCDWYLEMAKIRLRSSADDDIRGVLYHVLREIVKLLHPFVPFISEEIWQVLGEAPESVVIATYPDVATERVVDPQAEAAMQRFREAVSAVRTIRAELNVPATAKVEMLIRTDNSELTTTVDAKRDALLEMVGGTSVQIGGEIEAPPGSARQVIDDGEIYVPLAELIDVEFERSRLAKELTSVAGDLKKTRGKLENRTFLERAPEEVVQKEQAKLQEFLAKESRLRDNLASLG